MKPTQIPVPLQTQILIQAALALASLIAGIAFFLFFTATIAVPFFLLAILAAVNGRRIYRISVLGHYLILSGTVLSVERTAVLHRPKALLAEIDGKVLRIVLRNRHRPRAEGGRIAVYVQDSAPIYEWKGIHLLSSYLAVTGAETETSP